MQAEIMVPINCTNNANNANNAQDLFSSKVPCGFPSPAEDHVASKLDLNQHLIKHPAATFFVRVTGDSMINAGIFDGDLLIVDRSIQPYNRAIVIAVIAGELTVKRLLIKADQIMLVPENPAYKAIPITEHDVLQCWGVVTHAIHDVNNPK